MRPANRQPMPDMERMLKEANEVLAASGLPACASIEPVADHVPIFGSYSSADARKWPPE